MQFTESHFYTFEQKFGVNSHHSQTKAVHFAPFTKKAVHFKVSTNDLMLMYVHMFTNLISSTNTYNSFYLLL